MAGAEDDTGFGGLRKMLSGPAVDVPCRMLCSGLQVARVIGKAGVLIKELREESGCIVNILDTQLPVAFTNRDERILLLRGTLEQIAIAVSGILRLSLGMNAGIKGDSEEHKRTVEIMIPEPSCSHLIGEKGARIGALMDETHCDLHIVREPVSGLLDQKRLRITGPTLKDMETAIMKVQECLVDLTKFGSLQDKHFDIREGPTAEADLVPRAKGPGSSVTVAMLLPKDEVGWVLGKRGSKISKLRERARVSVNDAETPPFPSQQVIIEINGAPLTELIHVLQLVLDDLMLRQDSGSTTRLLLPTDRFGAVIGQGGEVIARIAQQSGATLHQQPPERQGNNFYPMRVLEVVGSERERIAAASALYEAIENAHPGAAPQAIGTTSNFAQAAIARAQDVPRAKDPPTPEVYGSIVAERITAARQDTATAAELSQSENGATSPQLSVDQGGHSRNPVSAALSPSVVRVPEKAPVALLGDAPALASSSFQQNGPACAQPIEVDRLGSRASHLPSADSGSVADGTQSKFTATPSFIEGVNPKYDGHGPSITAAPATPEPLQPVNGTTSSSCTLPHAASNKTTLFVVLPGADVVGFLVGSDLGIARRTGSELMAGHGANGETLLRISGSPTANAVACYLVQEAMWMSGMYSMSPAYNQPMRA